MTSSFFVFFSSFFVSHLTQKKFSYFVFVLNIPFVRFLLHFFSFLFFFYFAGERPEAMQTGTSTYISNSHCVAHTLLFGIIISICNMFSHYLSSIFYSMYELNLITGRIRCPKRCNSCSSRSSRSKINSHLNTAISTSSNKVISCMTTETTTTPTTEQYAAKCTSATIIRLHTNYAFLHQR